MMMRGPISRRSGNNMGYYTYFSLALHGKTDDVEACEQTIKSDLDDFSEALLIGESVEAKWYEWEIDMDKIAKKHPNVIIQLCGDGEASDDMWECRWYQGNKEYHCIEMPPFTEIKLPSEK
jgi:uncharacterized protein YodC (DUF2158 family)